MWTWEITRPAQGWERTALIGAEFLCLLVSREKIIKIGWNQVVENLKY